MSWIGASIATLGALISLLAAVGLFRFSGALSRLQPIAKASVAGLALVLIGTVATVPSLSVAVKAALVMAVSMVVTPIASHLVARAAYRAREHDMAIDELSGVAPEELDRG